MEDAHIAYINMDNSGISLFGVFDGHGGIEVALYAKRHFKEQLVKLSSYRAK
jgi:serine/threonine protein phosphatase PrpC